MLFQGPHFENHCFHQYQCAQRHPLLDLTLHYNRRCSFKSTLGRGGEQTIELAEGRRDEGGSSQSLGPQPRLPPLSGENQSSQAPWELPCGTSGKTEGKREERSRECVCGGGGGSGKRPACVQNGEGVQEGHWALRHAAHICNLILCLCQPSSSCSWGKGSPVRK